jgi:hypothetical protein
MTNIWIGLLAGCLCASYRGRPANQTEHGIFTLSEIGTADFYCITPKPSSLHSYPLNDLEEPGEWRRDRTEPQSACTVPKPAERSRRMKREALVLIGEQIPAAVRKSATGFAVRCLGTASVTASHSMDDHAGTHLATSKPTLGSSDTPGGFRPLCSASGCLSVGPIAIPFARGA